MEPYDPKRDLENYHYPTLDLLKKYDNDGKPYIDMAEQTANKNRIVDVLRAVAEFARCADAACQDPAVVLRIVDERLDEPEALDRAGGLYVGAATGAETLFSADGYVVLVHIIDGHILRDVFEDRPFHNIQIDVGLIAGEDQKEALLNVAVDGSGHIFVAQIALRKVFRRMGHLAVFDGFVDDLMDLVGGGAEDGWAGHDDLLAHADQQIGLLVHVGIEQFVVLHDDSAVSALGLHDGIRQHAGLGKAHLEPDVHVVGVGRVEDVLFVDVQQGQRPHVDPGIVVGELQTGEHALDEHGLAGAGFAQDADDVVERR